MTEILMVEDNPNLLHLNRSVLERQKYKVHAAENLAQARVLLNENPNINLAVLDIMLPDGNGLDFANEVKQIVGCPVIMLTSKSSHSDIVRGLCGGADDYLTKPYRIEELTARIQVLLQKSNNPPPHTLSKGLLELNVLSGRAVFNGEDLLLQPREFAILTTLLEHEGRLVLSETLYDAAWSQCVSGNTGALKTAVSRLRQKLKGSGFVIESERGNGYRIICVK